MGERKGLWSMIKGIGAEEQLSGKEEVLGESRGGGDGWTQISDGEHWLRAAIA